MSLFVKITGFLERLKGMRGFTMLELVLSLMVIGSIFGIVAETLMREADTYAFIVHRKVSAADARYALKRMTRELLYIDTSDLQDISSTKIVFSDGAGDLVTFSLATNGQDLAVFRSGDVLIPRVKSFNIEYSDGLGNPLPADPAQIPNVRRIRLSIATEPLGDEGEITLSTSVIPRAFLGYTDYQ